MKPDDENPTILNEQASIQSSKDIPTIARLRMWAMEKSVQLCPERTATFRLVEFASEIEEYVVYGEQRHGAYETAIQEAIHVVENSDVLGVSGKAVAKIIARLREELEKHNIKV